MSSCASLTDITLAQNCTGIMGGIKKAWLIDFDEITTAPVLTDGELTTAPVLDATGNGWKSYEFRKQSGSMTSTLNLDDATGLNYITTDLLLNFAKMETAKRTAIAAMCHVGVAAVVLDSNGIYWYLGYDNPVTVSASTGQTGQNYGDANQYSITLQDMSVEYPYAIAASSIASWFLDNGGTDPNQ